MALPKCLQNTLSIPVIGAPLFIVSNPDLVIAQCKAGIVGAFPALNARPKEKLDDWLQKINDDLDEYKSANPSKPVAPYAVNQIVHRSNDRLHYDMELCVKYKVPIIITSLRPPEEVVSAVHSYGGVVFHDVINIRHAMKAIEQGVDGIITVCAGAGGHCGSLSPFALVKEVRAIFDGTIILSGSITSGGDILAAQAMGADLACIGTRFISTKEANATNEHKQMIVDSVANDIICTSLFTGVRGSYLKKSITKVGLDPDNLEDKSKKSMNFSSEGADAVKAWRDILSAGQGVGNINDVPETKLLIEQLEKEYKKIKKQLLLI